MLLNKPYLYLVLFTMYKSHKAISKLLVTRYLAKSFTITFWY